jgi:predicted nucleotidyltransferase
MRDTYISTTIPAETASLVHQLKIGLQAILPGYPVTLAYLYGSAAAGRATPLSDVDIALVVNEELDPYQQLKLELRIETELAERANVRNAEVRIINGAPLTIRGQVACRGILLYCTDEDARVQFETATRDEYFDYLPIARQLREAFFADVRERGLHGRS